MSLPPTSFSRKLTEINHLNEKGFAEWVFFPGMLFQSLERWWDTGGFRNRPHEGIDVCMFRDTSGTIHHIDVSTKIPVMYDGYIARVIDDYIGKTVFVRHGFSDNSGSVLFSIYGHSKVYEGIKEAVCMHEGERLGTIKKIEDKKLNMLPHLHLSVAWIPEDFPSGDLNWDIVHNPGVVTLVDPVEVLGIQFGVI